MNSKQPFPSTEQVSVSVRLDHINESLLYQRAGPALIITTNIQMKSNPDSRIVKPGSKYISQGRKHHSSKPVYKPQPMVQMEFAFELARLNRQRNTQFPR